jgi:hypothetical protein
LLPETVWQFAPPGHCPLQVHGSVQAHWQLQMLFQQVARLP